MVRALVIIGFWVGSLCSAQTEALVQARCSGCHPTPRASVLPKSGWPPVLKSMDELIAAAGLPLSLEESQRIKSYYLLNAPETLAIIPDNYADSELRFNQESIGELKVHSRPEVTSLKFSDLDGDGNQDDLVVTDNLNGSISWVREVDGKFKETLLASANAPVNTTAMDIDGDGDTDYGISIMGYMHPNDQLIGEFRLLINQGDGRFQTQTLLKDTPRITDCAPGDYDGDGDIDIVVAMFGWRTTGGIAFLEQTAPGKFEAHTIDSINGCMRVISGHFDGDQQLDFIALITQQHEIIARYVNQGDNKFSAKILAQANHPTFGSSSIALADLDQDGDEDILYTNGDMMDEHPQPKPYHGVRWFENKDFQYHLHPIASMPGCYDAKPQDMDGDGDLDLVLGALYFQWDQNDFPSLAWVENLGGFKSFQPRKIAYAPSNLANIAVGDINNDGKVDIIGGGMHVPGPEGRIGRLTLWKGE